MSTTVFYVSIVVFAVFILIEYFLFLPSIIFYTIKLVGVQLLPASKHRHSELVIAMLTFAYLSIIPFTCDIYILIYDYALGDEHEHSLSESSTSNYVFSILNYIIWWVHPFCMYGIIFCIFLRFWQMHFDTHLSISTLNTTWMMHLQPDRHLTDWYLSNRDTYGNLKYSHKYIFLVYIVFTMISTILHTGFHTSIYNSKYESSKDIVPFVIDFILQSIPVTFCYFLYRRIPKFYDQFSLKDEMYFLLLILGILLFSHLLFGTLHVWLLANHIIVHLLEKIIRSIIIFTFCMISTRWVIQRIEKEYGSYKSAQQNLLNIINPVEVGHRKRVHRGTHSNEHNFSIQSTSKKYDAWGRISLQQNLINGIMINDTVKDIFLDERMPVLIINSDRNRAVDEKIASTVKLGKILGKNESFAIFMQYLFENHLMNALLSFVEYVQFKDLVIANLKNVDRGTFKGVSKLAPSIPPSTTLHQPQIPNNFNLLFCRTSTEDEIAEVVEQPVTIAIIDDTVDEIKIENVENPVELSVVLPTLSIQSTSYSLYHSNSIIEVGGNVGIEDEKKIEMVMSAYSVGDISSTNTTEKRFSKLTHAHANAPSTIIQIKPRSLSRPILSNVKAQSFSPTHKKLIPPKTNNSAMMMITNVSSAIVPRMLQNMKNKRSNVGSMSGSTRGKYDMSNVMSSSSRNIMRLNKSTTLMNTLSLKKESQKKNRISSEKQKQQLLMERKKAKLIEDEKQKQLLHIYKCCAYQLYIKYISEDAELPTDLKLHTLKKLVKKMGALDTWLNCKISNNSLFHIFDQALSEQYTIIWNSYQRFSTTSLYNRIEPLFGFDLDKDQ